MKTLEYTFENGNRVTIATNNSTFPTDEYFWAVDELLRLKRRELGIRGAPLYSTVHPHNPDEPDDLDIDLDPETLSTTEVEIPMAEAKLPFDVEIGHMRFRKGVKLVTLIAAARRWYDKAFDGEIPPFSVVAEPQVD